MHRQTLMQNALSAAQETARLGFSATSEALLRVAWELYFASPPGGDDVGSNNQGFAEPPPGPIRRPD